MNSAQGTVVVFGGRSEIGVEVARRLAPGRTVILAARRADDLAGPRESVLAAGAAAVHTAEFDADALGTHQQVLDDLVAAHGPIDLAVLAFGILGAQPRAETDAAHAAAIVHPDYVAQVALLTRLASLLRARLIASSAMVRFSSRSAPVVNCTAATRMPPA